ncbi:V-containing nitrogenase subunit delta [Azospirillum sp. TSO22-1]|uniref:V-containing nitrogenase subunit delta n=1 Tax=Azospirillum sp. TSO22-1 TaxID=716789 RepID=UPI000D6098B5|nr:V-containing nitrogenase subunit delta [Azospirillum sp. TSO22-1]PWC42399.1 nitrogenase vanadium-iron protein delta chain [Azospirillum sp. TSO22-1]
MTSEAKVDQLYGYVQKRCLWQFFSRSWDRQENIDGVLGIAADLLTGKELTLETPQQRLFYADAKIMVRDFKERFPWIDEAGPAQVRDMLNGLKARLVDIAITGSKNRELHHSLY